MATFDFGGLLGSNMFGGGDTGLEEYLTEEQRARMNNQGIMALAASLLKSSGPSAVPIGIGQALGEAYGAGQQGYQQAQQGAIANIATRQKLDEAKRSRDLLSGMQKMLMGDYGQGVPVTSMPTAGVAITPEQSLAVPNMPAGPTVDRANMIGQLPTQAQVQPMQQAQQSSPFANLSREQRALMSLLPADQLAKSMTDVITASQEYGAPQNLMIGNKPVVVQYNKQGQRRIVSDAQPYEAQSSDIRAVEYLQGRPLGGTGAEGTAALGQYRSQIAPNTVVKLPPGPNSMATAGGTGAIEILKGTLFAAKGANDTLRNIDMIAPALDTAVLGPAADYRTSMLRVAKQLNIAGPDAEKTLQDTRQVVQGLAQSELAAAASMRGQGAITENERSLIKRTAAGDQTMTAAELRTGMAAMQKLANQRIKEHQDTYATAMKVPGFSDVGVMYQVIPYTSQTDLSGNLRVNNAIDEAIKRKTR
jgi:hypothetical protein